MAEARPFDLDHPEAHTLPVYRRLAVLNGLLIGLALALGTWGLEAVRVGRLSLPLYLPTLLLGVVALAALGAFVGWLTARLANTAVTVVLWLLFAVLSVLVMGHLPYTGRSLVVWLADPRFAGRMVFPLSSGGTVSGLILGGLLVLLALGLLGLLQGYRLENIAGEAQRKRTLGTRAWIALLLPLPLVFLAGLVTSSMMANPAAVAAQTVHRAIPRAQTFEGDLRELGEEGGIDYRSLRPVQDQIDGPFTLGVAEVDPSAATVIIAADFDNGAWVYCRVINGHLSFCYDAAPAHVQGLRSLVTGEPPPENCRGCALRATEEALGWLEARRPRFGPSPIVGREAQWGNAVLMRVAGEGLAAECWIVGVTRPVLTECVEE